MVEWLNDFLEEVISFPAAPHDDQVDAFTQALSYMRGSYFDSATFQETGRMMVAYDAARRRGVGYGQMINNVNDMLDYEDGPSSRGGGGYTNPGRLSRYRGAW